MRVHSFLLCLMFFRKISADNNTLSLDEPNIEMAPAAASAVDKSISQASTEEYDVPQAVLEKDAFRRVSEEKYDHILHQHQSRRTTVSPQKPSLSMSTDGGNVTTSTIVYVGRNATLSCRVEDIAEETASWMRQDGEMLKLVSYDTNVYASNERYSLNFLTGADWKSWQLIITRTRPEDAGLYRCQVASTPTLVMDITLIVKVPSTRIVDDHSEDVSEKHYNSGSMIELRCLVTDVPFPHDELFWMKNDKKLFFNTSKGGIKVKSDIASHAMSSRLYIAKASAGDSGLYTCWYGNLSRTEVSVHIITGENFAAMQHDAVAEGNSAMTPNNNYNFWILGSEQSIFGNIFKVLFSTLFAYFYVLFQS